MSSPQEPHPAHTPGAICAYLLSRSPPKVQCKPLEHVFAPNDERPATQVNSGAVVPGTTNTEPHTSLNIRREKHGQRKQLTARTSESRLLTTASAACCSEHVISGH